jgi:hemerythrin
MGLIAWKDSYSVNVDAFDAQHKRLVGYINELHDAMISGKAKDALSELLNGLVDYTRIHFASEEKLLTARKYPDLAAHISERQAFTRKVMEFVSAYQSGTAALSISVLDFLKGWLVNHILVSDKKYGAFLTSKAAD